MEEHSAKTLAHRSTTEAEDLHVCESCASELVQPLDWREQRRGSWAVTLVCPNCLHERHGAFDQTSVDKLDETLDDGYTTLLAELQEMVTSNLTDEIDRFVAALRAGAILPEDF